MTVLDRETVPSTAELPPVRKRLRSLIGWAIVAALVVIVVLVGARVGATRADTRGALDPDAVGGHGALALVELLRDQGVEVTVTRSRAEARSALDASTTLVTTNPYTLSDEGLEELLEPADRVVFLSTSSHLLNVLGLGSSASGLSDAVEASCDVPEFAKVGTIRPDRLFDPADGVEGCFLDDVSGAAAVLVDDSDGTRITAVEGARLFSNSALAENGNAALALALLAQTPKVVWYVPSFGDSDIEGASPDTLGSLTPPWVTPAILLLLLSGAAAAWWRGRRFGPLVAETLPVTVRASETMHGRARLTAKAADAGHAALALREGSCRRLARRLGLAENATGVQIADAAADRLRIPRGSLHALLGGPLPTDDANLIRFARQLDELETSVDASARDGRPS